MNPPARYSQRLNPGERDVKTFQNGTPVGKLATLPEDPIEPRNSRQQHAAAIEGGHKPLFGIGQRPHLAICRQSVRPQTTVIAGKAADQPGDVSGDRLDAHGGKVENRRHFVADK